MKIKPLLHKINSIFLILILPASFLLSSAQNSWAIPDRVRSASVDENGYCKTDNLDFGPMVSKDQQWELDNPVCITYVAAVGASVFVARRLAAAACNQMAQIGLISASEATGVVLSPTLAGDIIKDAGMCSTFWAAQNYGQAAVCCAGVVTLTANVGIAIGELRAIYDAAVRTQRDAHICGETWNTWQERPAGQESASDTVGIPDYQLGSLPRDSMYIYGAGSLSYQEKLRNKYENSTMALDISNKEYREFIYGGIETEDTGDEACQNPKSWAPDTRNKILGFTSDNQRYYMRGPNMSSNYACGRFLLYKGTNQEKIDARDAYECCKKRSQETICIKEGSNIKFCKEGSRCKVRDVWYEIYKAKTVPNYLCASTYSVCPYNHNLGGGTEIADYDDKYKILLNHCQYLKHCVKKPDVPYIRTSDLDGAWISSACFDLKGDSQNEYEYNGSLTPVNKTRNLSAPIAQCFKETLENIFINKAGNTKCSSPDETPDQDGNCQSGYVYKAGKVVLGQKSFFQIIQDNLQVAIKMVMTIAVTVMGIMVLLSGNPWDKKTILMFIVKLGLVAYFALGTAWQDYFFTGVSSVSADLSTIFTRIDQGQAEAEKDGCQFPRFNYAFVEGVNSGTKYDNPAYPPGKEYLQIWDTLDCKIARALGFGPEVSVPNLMMMILAGLISSGLGGLGVIFFVATFVFAFFLIALTVRALHIFLISSMAITILIYVSPITITAALFKKTEGIFKNWRTQLMSFIIQPLILFAYLGILITIFDKVLIGDAKFSGDGRAAPKRINCSGSTTVGGLIMNNVVNPVVNNVVNPVINNVIDPAAETLNNGNVSTISTRNSTSTAGGNVGDNSIYCIFHFNDIRANNALSSIGITLPTLINMNQAKLATIIKAALLMFIFTKFLDKISGPDSLAEKLSGGAGLGSSSKGVMDMMKSAAGISKGVQSRGSRGIRKWGGKLAGKIGGFIKNRASGYGNVKKNSQDIRDALGKNEGGNGPSTPPTVPPRSGKPLPPPRNPASPPNASGSPATPPPAPTPPTLPPRKPSGGDLPS